MAILTITKADGTSVPLPDPAQLSWSIQDIDADGTGRNQNGDLFRDRVAVKRKLTLSWPPMTAADMSTKCRHGHLFHGFISRCADRRNSKHDCLCGRPDCSYV